MHLEEFSRHTLNAQFLRARIRGSGVNFDGRPLWTEAEETTLRKLYPDFSKIMSELPHRRRPSLWHRCQKLGLKQKRHQWLASELSKLRRLYPSQSRSVILAAFPEMSWDAIRMAAKYYGIGRNVRRFEYRRTGKPAMDAILSRIEDILWSLSDLDEASGTRTYFRNQSWRHARLNFNNIQRAVQALDGELVVVWKQYE